MDQVEAIMTFMLPIILGVFQNQTEPAYKAQFQKPCEFNDMLNMFGELPPYFNEIGRLYPNKTDLVAYYSMQLASTFLVNKGSLTMNCLYNMLDVQSRLGVFAIGILDHPERYQNVVGAFGMFMKPQAKPLRNNAMLQILEYVDKYEKNNDRRNVNVFTTFNIIFMIISLVGIVTNVIIILVLKSTNHRQINNRRNNKLTATQSSQIYNDGYSVASDSTDTSFNENADLYHRYWLLAKRYRTRICLILISICHLFYLKINFIVMSQFKFAAVALGQLNKSQFGCKMAFFLFPPTTPYNILHQYAVWLLIYALVKHSSKLRRTKYIEEDDYNEVGTMLRSTVAHRTMKSTSSRRSGKHASQKSTVCCCFEESGRNIFNCILIFLAIIIYNSQNLLFYSLNQLTLPKDNQTISFCAFEPFYSNYYVLITQHIVPALNLFLFVFLPMLIGVLYVAFDICYFIRLKREQNKLYQHIHEYHAEWLIYVYFVVFFISQLPLFIHQLIDIVFQSIKFPFVFPLFIGLIFSNKVSLVVFEMTMLCLGFASNFLWWMIFDANFRNIIKFYLNKYILCRTLNLAIKRKQFSDDDDTGDRNNLRILEMPTSSLIYKKQHRVQQSSNIAPPQCSTSTTSTNDDKIDAIETLTEDDDAKYNKNRFDMIDDDDLNDYKEQQQPPQQYKYLYNTNTNAKLLAATANEKPPATHPNYENIVS